MHIYKYFARYCGFKSKEIQLLLLKNTYVKLNYFLPDLRIKFKQLNIIINSVKIRQLIR